MCRIPIRRPGRATPAPPAPRPLQRLLSTTASEHIVHEHRGGNAVSGAASNPAETVYSRRSGNTAVPQIPVDAFLDGAVSAAVRLRARRAIRSNPPRLGFTGEPVDRDQARRTDSLEQQISRDSRPTTSAPPPRAKDTARDNRGRLLPETGENCCAYVWRTPRVAGLPEVGRAVAPIDRVRARWSWRRAGSFPAPCKREDNYDVCKKSTGVQRYPDRRRPCPNKTEAAGSVPNPAREDDGNLVQPNLGGRARPSGNLASHHDRDRRGARYLSGLPRGPGRRPETGARDNGRTEDEDRTHPGPRRGPRRIAGPELARTRRHRSTRHHGRGRRDGPATRPSPGG